VIKNKFLRNNILILILMNMGNVFNYLFQLIVGRNLTPEEYGAFNSLNSLGVLIATPLAVLPLVLSKFTVTFSVEGLEKVRELFHISLKYLFLISVVVFALGSAGVPLIREYLNLETSIPVFIILLQMSFCLLIPVAMGILQGLERFMGFGLAGSSLTLVRFLSGLLLVGVFGWGVNGALLSGLLGVLFSIVIGLLFLKDMFNGQREQLPQGIMAEMGRYSIPVLLTSTAVAALGNLDLILVRHYCQPEEAGFYATAAILGRIALYLPGVLIMVLFPSAVKAHTNGQRDNHALWLTLGLTGLVGGGFALVCSLWPEMIINLLFGPQYVDSASLFRMIAIAMAMLAMANVFFIFSLACSDYGYLWVLGSGLAGMLISVFFFHAHPMQIAWALLGSTLFIFFGTMGWFVVKNETWKAVGNHA